MGFFRSERTRRSPFDLFGYNLSYMQTLSQLEKLGHGFDKCSKVVFFGVKISVMNYSLPYTIENCIGEKLIFQGIEKTPEGDKLIVEGICQPGAGPIMHTHFRQDESITVVSGRMGYQVMGGEKKYAGPGETVLFKRGTPHKFWAEGNEVLVGKGWVQPSNSIIFYLSSMYAAQNKANKGGQPDLFDGAYLLTRYRSEYDAHEIPPFVKKVIMPIAYRLGRITGRYKHFQGAPEPLK